MFAWVKRGRRPPRDEHAVIFHTYPKLLFAWPIIVAGLLFWPIARWDGAIEVLGWVYLFILLLVILTIGVDIERNHAVFWAAIFGLVFFLGKWLADVQHFTFFGDLYRAYAELELRYNPGFGVAMSTILALPYCCMLLWARINDRWRITHNEFEHYAWGRADDSLARGAKRVRSTYPDLLELLLCGAGTLIVYSATGRSELRRIPHVPMIFFVRKRINRLLESTAVTHTELQAEEEVSEEQEEPSVPGEPETQVGQREPL